MHSTKKQAQTPPLFTANTSAAVDAAVVNPLLGRALLLLVIWLSYGVLIQNVNLRGFCLHQLGVESIVERGHFYLEGSPTVQVSIDVFPYKGHLYAAKQPGQFMIGALAYSFVRHWGLSYLGDYDLTAALVTFLTASFFAAVGALAVFELARRLAGPQSSLLWPLGTALAFALATTLMPYAGIAHHDVIATSFLVMAFYCVVRLDCERGARGGLGRSAAAGLLLGLTVTTSMLPFFMVLAVGIYFLTLRRWRLLPCFLAGGLLGLLPLFVYDALSFGNPLLLPNIAGRFSETYFSLGWPKFVANTHFYVTMLSQYAPICWCGLGGMALFPRSLRGERRILLLILAALAGYVSNMGTTGYCQYGPRYLLPAMPFLALGLMGFTHIPLRARRWATGGLLAVGLFSAITNFVGAIGGANYGDLELYALPRYLRALQAGQFPREFPLATSLGPPLALCVIGLVIWCAFQPQLRGTLRPGREQRPSSSGGGDGRPLSWLPQG